MARGNAQQTQVFYKGSSGEQFTVFIESEEELKKWKADSSIALSNVVAGWKILVAGCVLVLFTLLVLRSMC